MLITYALIAVGLALFFVSFCYLKRVPQEVFFGNVMGISLILFGPLLYVYAETMFPEMGYDVVFRIMPLSMSMGAIVISLPLLLGVFKWKDIYEEHMPLVSLLKDDKKKQVSCLCFGIALLFFQGFKDGWFL